MTLVTFDKQSNAVEQPSNLSRMVVVITALAGTLSTGEMLNIRIFPPTVDILHTTQRR